MLRVKGLHMPVPGGKKRDIPALKARVKISEVAAAYGVQAVSESRGEKVCLCPFHDDHSPSMCLVDRKGFAFCFSCDKGWDHVAFIAEMDKVGVNEAINRLERMAGDPGDGKGWTIDHAKARQMAETRAAAMIEMQKRAEAEFEDHRKRLVEPEWKRAKLGTEPVVEYLVARGVPREAIGPFSPAIRYGRTMHPSKAVAPCVLCAMSHPELDRDAGFKRGGLAQVQRIFLAADGSPRKFDGEAKLTLGKIKRGERCELTPPDVEGGVLVLCEGFETGEAIRAALRTHGGAWGCAGAAVWMLKDTSVLKNITLSEDDWRWVKRVIIAADADRFHASRSGGGFWPGLKAAESAAAELLAEARERGARLDVWINAPSYGITSLINEYGEPADGAKSVDWLDVLKDRGLEETAAALLRSLEFPFWCEDDARGVAGPDEEPEWFVLAPAPGPAEDASVEHAGADTGEDAPWDPPGEVEGGASGGGDEGGGGAGGGGDDGLLLEGPELPPGGASRIFPIEGTLKARIILTKLFTPPAGVLEAAGDDGACFALRYWAKAWWVWTGLESAEAPRWRRIDDDLLRSRIREHVDSGYWQLVVKVEGEGKRRRRVRTWKKIALGDHTVEDLLAAVKVYAAAQGNDAPRWLPAQLDAGGRSEFDTQVAWDQPLALAGSRAYSPLNTVAVHNGLLDLLAFANDGVAELKSHTPRWFSFSCLPFSIDVDTLNRLASLDEKAWEPGGEADVFFAQRTPHYTKFVREAFMGDAMSVSVYEEFAGYCLTGDTSFHKLLWIQGPPGGGKGVLADILYDLVGRANVGMVNLGQLGGRFDLSPLQGKSLLHMDEARVGPQTDTASALDNILRISSGRPVRIEDKGETALGEGVTLHGKLVITLNEEPSWKDASGALVRRLLVLLTGEPPREPDRLLFDKIRPEMPWLACKVVLRLRHLIMREKFQQPERGRDLLDDIARNMDKVAAFVQDCIQVDGQSVEFAHSVFDAFLKWHVGLMKSEAKMEPPTFGKKFRAACGSRLKTGQQADDNDGGRRKTVYRGIKLKHEFLWGDGGQMTIRSEGPAEVPEAPSTLPGPAEDDDIPF